MKSDEMKMIYNRLVDRESEIIFENRVMYNLTGDSRYVERMSISEQKIMDWLVTEIDKYDAGTELIINGISLWGQTICNSLKQYRWTGFCNRDKKVESIFGIPVFSRDEAIEKYPNAVHIISPINIHKQIYNELVDKGIKNIINFGKYILDTYEADEKQYLDVFQFNDNEIVADVGCLDCDTIFKYFKYANNKYEHIYSFEPDKKQYEICKDIVEKGNYKNWDIVNKAAFEDDTIVHFSSSGSSVSDDGDEEIEAVRLDTFFSDKAKPTFIKMDIEGAEMSALKGAKDIISKYAPKLAICVYHKPEDIYEIPKYLLELNPSYRFYLRHYTNRLNDTVLYAVDC